MKILRLQAVKEKQGHASGTSVYNEQRDGLLTTAVAIGKRARGWPDYEIDAILSARIAGKSDDQIRELVKLLHAKRAELVILQGAA
jgi:prophage regulatory protein